MIHSCDKAAPGNYIASSPGTACSATTSDTAEAKRLGKAVARGLAKHLAVDCLTGGEVAVGCWLFDCLARRAFHMLLRRTAKQPKPQTAFFVHRLAFPSPPLSRSDVSHWLALATDPSSARMARATPSVVVFRSPGVVAMS